MKVLITGGSGQCGSALVALPHDKILFDREKRPDNLSHSQFIQGDLGDTNILIKALEGCDAVIHLAAASKINSSWDDVLKENIKGTNNILEAARMTGVERVIFASSNHVVGMYELEHAPEIYELGHKHMLTQDVTVRPDSLYGVSKVFGENLGRFYAENGGPKFYAIRIGALVHEDHPYAHAERGVISREWERNSPQYNLQVKRLKSLWISKRDFVQLINHCLYYDGPDYDSFYAVSNNPRRWLDIEHPRKKLGYEPQDNAEEWLSPPQLDTTIAKTPGKRISEQIKR